MNTRAHTHTHTHTHTHNLRGQLWQQARDVRQAGFRGGLERRDEARQVQLQHAQVPEAAQGAHAEAAQGAHAGPRGYYACTWVTDEKGTPPGAGAARPGP